MSLSLLSIVAAPVMAQTPSSAPVATEKPVQLAFEWTVHSSVIGEDRRIMVHLPDGYDPAKKRYPVVYVLDADGLFIPAVAVAEMMPWAYRSPELIVVGVPNVSRSRDFTTPCTAKVAPSSVQQFYMARAGGADQFLSFLKTELIPQIDRRYATAPYRVLVGHSLSGLFALHAFDAAPGLFNATVAASPALSWNDDQVIRDMGKRLTLAGTTSDYLFVSRAEKEFDDTPRAVAKLEELLRLRAPAIVHWRTEVVPAEDHGTAMLPGLQAGLEWAFINWRLPSLIFDEGIESVDRFYAGLSKQYGFSILPPESELAPLAKHDLDRNASDAVRDYRRWAVLYPESIDARVGLTDGLAASGKTIEAAAALDEAIRLAADQKDSRLPDLQSRRAKLPASSGGATR
jgi:predicted alpha/beta superfamily hydrolase